MSATTPNVLVITDLGIDDSLPRTMTYVHHTQIIDTLRDHMDAYQKDTYADTTGPALRNYALSTDDVHTEAQAILDYFGCGRNRHTLAEQEAIIATYDGTTILTLDTDGETSIVIMPIPAPGVHTNF